MEKYNKLIWWLCNKYQILDDVKIKHQKTNKIKQKDRYYFLRIVEQKYRYVFKMANFDKLTFISEDDKFRLIITEFIRVFLLKPVIKKIKSERKLRKVLSNNSEKILNIYKSEVIA